MGTVTSKDGTTIAYQATGDGPPLVLIGGATNDRTQWDAVAPLLAYESTVYAIDRRGRGESDDRPHSSVEDEIEDVLAVLAITVGDALLVGHSSGALLALRAAVRCDWVRGIVAYEPPPSPAGGAAVVDRLSALVESGDRERALTVFMTDCVGLPASAVDARRDTPMWQEALALAHTVAYDAAIVTEGLPSQEALGLTTPVRLFLGGASPKPMIDNVHRVATQLTTARIEILDGEQHFAISAAPELFVRHVLSADFGA